MTKLDSGDDFDHNVAGSGRQATVAPDPAFLRPRPAVVLRVLLVIISVLVVAGLIAHLLRFGFGLTSAFGFIRLFDLNQEANVPTWFSSVLLAMCALLLALIAVAKRTSSDRWFLHWAALGVIFALMSLDEIASVHERFMEPLKSAFELGGLLTNAWVLLAFVFLPVLLLIYFRFLLMLPRRSLGLFLLSAAVYLGGVVGVEMFSGAMKSTYGFDSLNFALMTTLEEALEMIGLALFIHALLDYMANSGDEWRLIVRARASRH